MNLSKVIPHNVAGKAKPWEIPDLIKNNDVVSLNAPGGGGEDLNLVALREEMMKKGFQEGYEAGLAKALEKTKSEQQRLEAIFRSLSKPLQRKNDAIEHELIELALAVAKLILRREITQDPRHIIGLIREAIKQLPTTIGGVRIHMQPDDAKLVRETLNQQDDDQRWQIRDDPTMQHGSCEIHTENSFIDASIDALITRLNIDLLGGSRTTDKNESTDEVPDHEPD